MPRESIIQVFRSTTPSAIPSGLTQGELAVNLADTKLFVGGTGNKTIDLIGETTVSRFNGFTGAVGISAGDNITITQSGLTFTIASSGGGGGGMTSTVANTFTALQTFNAGISASGATFSGDIAVNGGDITSSASTFNLLNTTPATINAFDNATSVSIGKSTGTNNSLIIFGGHRFDYTSGMASVSNLSFLGNSSTIDASSGLDIQALFVNIGDPAASGNGTYLEVSDAFQSFEFNNGNLNINGNEANDVVLREYSEVKTAPTISSNTLTLSLSNTNFFEVSLNANINTLTISDCRATANTVTGFTLIFTADGTARTVTWPASVKWPNNDPPALTSTNGKKDILSFISPDNGTTWYGFIGGLNY